MVTQIGGWTDERIVADVYTNLSGSYLLSHAEKINEVIEIVTQNDTKRAYGSDFGVIQKSRKPLIGGEEGIRTLVSGNTRPSDFESAPL